MPSETAPARVHQGGLAPACPTCLRSRRTRPPVPVPASEPGVAFGLSLAAAVLGVLAGLSSLAGASPAAGASSTPAAGASSLTGAASSAAVGG